MSTVIVLNMIIRVGLGEMFFVRAFVLCTVWIRYNWFNPDTFCTFSSGSVIVITAYWKFKFGKIMVPLFVVEFYCRSLLFILLLSIIIVYPFIVDHYCLSFYCRSLLSPRDSGEGYSNSGCLSVRPSLTLSCLRDK